MFLASDPVSPCGEPVGFDAILARLRHPVVMEPIPRIERVKVWSLGYDEGPPMDG